MEFVVVVTDIPTKASQIITFPPPNPYTLWIQRWACSSPRCLQTFCMRTISKSQCDCGFAKHDNISVYLSPSRVTMCTQLTFVCTIDLWMFSTFLVNAAAKKCRSSACVVIWGLPGRGPSAVVLVCWTLLRNHNLPVDCNPSSFQRRLWPFESTTCAMAHLRCACKRRGIRSGRYKHQTNVNHR